MAKKTKSSPSSHYLHLKKAWLKKHKRLQKRLIAKHKEAIDWVQDSSRQLAAGSLASALMLAHPVSGTILAQTISPTIEPAVEVHTVQELEVQMKEELPQQVDPLTVEQEQKIGETLSQYFNVNAKAELGGKRLNRSYGLIGAEQHLMRYPGDTISTHFSSQAEASQYGASGMAPGRGGWGYFTEDDGTLSQKGIEREKYYIAVQTFLAPGWSEHTAEYYQFFKYRKMLIVNPENGRGMVVVIGDAGPAPWTGKHLGGSPEVMQYLDRHDGAARGPVLYFFIDDPDDSIPLGPREVQ